MSISVKAYLNIADNQTEIRRFSIDSDASTSYVYLVEKIRNVYPSVKRDNIKLFWKDQDEELVRFSSDEELIEALTHSQGEFFRIFVKADKNSLGNNNDQKGQVHLLVTCDGCEGNVVGSRFKCTVCPDYDLCSDCESKGLHAQHYLIRIRNPGATPFLPCFLNMPWMQGSGMRRGCGDRRYGGPWRGSFNGFRRGSGGCSRPSQGPGNVPFRCPSGDGSPQETGESSQAGEAGVHERRNGTEEEQVPFFHQFGELLNTILRPYGVDVHTFVEDHQGQEGECGQHKGKRPCPRPPNTDGEERETSASHKQDNFNEEPMDEASSSQTGDQTYVVVGTTEHDGKNKEDDSALAEAIARMKAMGFDDENGWLSQLLKAKNFDINKVLDAIQHPRKK